MSLTDFARILEMSVAGIGFAVERGEGIVRDNNLELLEQIIKLFKSHIHNIKDARLRLLVSV